MQEALHHVHEHQYTKSCKGKQREGKSQFEHTFVMQGSQDHIEEHLSKLAMSQAESPESEITCGVAHSSKHKLDRFYQLMDHALVEVKVRLRCIPRHVVYLQQKPLVIRRKNLHIVTW